MAIKEELIFTIIHDLRSVLISAAYRIVFLSCNCFIGHYILF